MNNLLGTGRSKMVVRWPPSYVQCETAGTESSLQTRLPYQTEGALFSGTGGEHESQSVDKTVQGRWNTGCVGKTKNASNARRNNCHLWLRSNVLQNDVDLSSQSFT